MNNNESFNMSRDNSPDLSDADCTAMTDEELALYREVLESAYPKPKRDIKAGVMTAVRRDAALKKKRAVSRSLIMKWGGLAACIALVAAVSIRVLPSFLSDDMVEYASDASAAQQAETEAGNSAVFTTFSDRSAKRTPGFSDSSTSADADEAYEDTSAEENDVSYDDVPAEAMYMAYSTAAPASEEECIEEAAIPEAAAEEYCEDVIEEAPVTEEVSSDAEVPNDAILYAFSGIKDENAITIVAECSHTEVFSDSYHTIPYELVIEAGKEEFLAWEEETESAADPCTVNIRSFIDHFGISEETFGIYLTTTDAAYSYDYPLDILYGDAEACERYYSGGGSYEKMLADHFEYRLKLALIEEIDEAEYEEWLGKFPYQTVRAWSISEFVTDHGIPEPRFNEIYETAADEFKTEFGVDEVHGYDTVKLYVNAVGIKMALASSQLGYYADVSCRK